MSITQLQYFRAVCKFGSTVKAAEAMYVSQPSISSAINKLEEEFGITLFTRQNNRLVLGQSGCSATWRNSTPSSTAAAPRTRST